MEDKERELIFEVAGMAGVGRFVVGLLDDIRIVDSPELTKYIREYLAANAPQIR